MHYIFEYLENKLCHSARDRKYDYLQNVSSYLSCKEADVLPLDVFAESHLKQSQSHVKGLHDVGLASQRMVSVQVNCYFNDNS